MVQRLDERSYFVVKAIIAKEKANEDMKAEGVEIPDNISSDDLDLVQRLEWSPPVMRAIASLADRVNQIGEVILAAAGMDTKDKQAFSSIIPEKPTRESSLGMKKKESLDDAFARLQGGLIK